MPNTGEVSMFFIEQTDADPNLVDFIELMTKIDNAEYYACCVKIRRH